MAVVTTNTNEYLEELRKQIELLDSVRVCELYGGELDVDDVDKLKVDLRVAGKCHTFIDLAAIKYEKDKVHGQIFANMEIQVYVLGVFDRTSKGHSLDCSNCVEDIMEMINCNADKILRPQPGFTNLGAAGQLANAIRKNQRFSIWYTNFNQRIRIK